MSVRSDWILSTTVKAFGVEKVGNVHVGYIIWIQSSELMEFLWEQGGIRQRGGRDDMERGIEEVTVLIYIMLTAWVQAFNVRSEIQHQSVGGGVDSNTSRTNSRKPVQYNIEKLFWKGEEESCENTKSVDAGLLKAITSSPDWWRACGDHTAKTNSRYSGKQN